MQDLHAWIADHYAFVLVGEGADRHPTVRCRRCGMDVFAVTKHAVHVHGDPIQVMPPTPDHAHLTTDHEGRLIEA